MSHNRDLQVNIDHSLRSKGYRLIIGVDEVGRGSLAGPLVVCALALPPDHNIRGIKDSKRLTEKAREELAEQIRERSIAYSIAKTDSKEIDRLNIRTATLKTMRRAVLNLVKKLGAGPNIVLVDGKDIIDIPFRCRSVIKGDLLSEHIGAASIVAKVYRDNLMKRLDQKYPGYGFAVHKGYATKLHYDAISRIGICELHRRSFRLF